MEKCRAFYIITRMGNFVGSIPKSKNKLYLKGLEATYDTNYWCILYKKNNRKQTKL